MDKPSEAQIIAVIDAQQHMSLATLRPDGAPHASAVSYVNDGLTLWFAVSPSGAKAAELSHDARVSLTITPPHESWDEIVAVSIAGRATRLEDASEMGKVGRLLLGKFPQLANYGRGDGDMVAMFRVDPVLVTLLDYRRGFGHARTFELE